MTDSAAVERVAAVAASLVPLLTERLARHGLGEIEIERGDVRVRVAAARVPAGPAPAPRTGTSAAAGAAGRAAEPRRPDGTVVRSPAVGYFVAHDGLAVGQAVVAGADVGHVDMLGIRHEVRAEVVGTIRRLAVEDGQAVEFGQDLLEIGSGGS